MKTLALSTTLVALLLAAIFVACDKTNDPQNNPVFLKDAHQIARDTKGFYVRTCEIAVTKDSENDQKRLHLILNNSKLKPYIINVFLEEKDWKAIDIESGSFELLFVKHALLLRDPLTEKQYTFAVKNEAYNALEASLPKGYLAKSPVTAIGIAVYGQPLQQAAF